MPGYKFDNDTRATRKIDVTINRNSNSVEFFPSSVSFIFVYDLYRIVNGGSLGNVPFSYLFSDIEETHA